MSYIPRWSMVALGVELPDAEHREWLLDGLARLIRLSGWKPFVGAPILRPTNRYFPDVWEQGPGGVRTLLRRLMRYAGLEQFRIRLHVYREYNAREFDQHGIGHAGPGTAAWFAGIAGGACTFGVNASELRDTEELVGTLGHEVAHAFRYQHGLVVQDAHIEERLTDLTAVYLGFGVFLLNSSFSFKTGGYSQSGERLLYEKRERGYLSLPQIALLFGAQLAAREVARTELRAILAALSANQASLVEQALESFEDGAALRERLGVPEPESWGPLAALEDLAAPLDRDDDETEGDPPESQLASTPEAGPGPALRVVNDLRGLGAVTGAVVPFLVAMLGLIDGWELLAAPLALGILGWVLGSRVARDECSVCGARVPRDAESCAGCGRSFAASVRNRDEQLAAEERLAEAEPDPDSSEEHDWSLHEPESRLMTAMYAAWAIRRDLMDPEFAERAAELVVRVRCGEFSEEELSSLWVQTPELLNDEAAQFMSDYSSGSPSLADQDYSRLVSSVRLTDSEASYRRIAEVLDSRFEAWLREDQPELASR